jgi:AraC-like DNA-binding protein
MSLVFDTATVPAQDRREFLETAASELFGPLKMSPTPEVPVKGRALASDAGPLKLVTFDASAHAAERTRQLAAQATDSYGLLLMLRGKATAIQDGREASWGRGDFMIYDLSRPSAFVSDGDFWALACVVPRYLVALSPDLVARVTAMSISGHDGVGWVVAPFLHRFARMVDRDQMTGDLLPLVEGVPHLLEALCRSQLGDRWPQPLSRMELLSRIRAYIDTNLGDSELSPAQIASAHHISKRYLHTLFEPTATTVGGFVRERRLERCRQQLGDPAHAHESISWISVRWGIPDSGHLSRLFRKAYGCTPGEYRHEQLLAKQAEAQTAVLDTLPPK